MKRIYCQLQNIIYVQHQSKCLFKHKIMQMFHRIFLKSQESPGTHHLGYRIKENNKGGRYKLHMQVWNFLFPCEIWNSFHNFFLLQCFVCFYVSLFNIVVLCVVLLLSLVSCVSRSCCCVVARIVASATAEELQHPHCCTAALLQPFPVPCCRLW